MAHANTGKFDGTAAAVQFHIKTLERSETKLRAKKPLGIRSQLGHTRDKEAYHDLDFEFANYQSINPAHVFSFFLA